MPLFKNSSREGYLTDEAFHSSVPPFHKLTVAIASLAGPKALNSTRQSEAIDPSGEGLSSIFAGLGPSRFDQVQRSSVDLPDNIDIPGVVVPQISCGGPGPCQDHWVHIFRVSGCINGSYCDINNWYNDFSEPYCSQKQDWMCPNKTGTACCWTVSGCLPLSC